MASHFLSAQNCLQILPGAFKKNLAFPLFLSIPSFSLANHHLLPPSEASNLAYTYSFEHLWALIVGQAGILNSI